MRGARYRTVVVAIALLLLAIFASACGAPGGWGASSGGSEDDAGSGSPGDASVAQDSRALEGPAPSGGELASSEAAQDPDATIAQGSGGSESGSAGQSLPTGFDRKIAKSAELGLEAESVRESTAEAQRIASRFDGNVLSSELRGDEDNLSASIVLAVPSQEFEAALEELRGLGKTVTADTVRGEDVTEEFVDLESRERNLLAAEESLLALYERAQNVEDTLTVQRELTNVRGEIEQVQGRIKYLENRTTTSSISLNIQPVPAPQPKPAAWSPAKVATQAWEASLAVLRTLATAVISAVVFGWWLVPALVAGLLWWRKRNRDSTSAASP